MKIYCKKLNATINMAELVRCKYFWKKSSIITNTETQYNCKYCEFGKKLE